MDWLGLAWRKYVNNLSFGTPRRNQKWRVDSTKGALFVGKVRENWGRLAEKRATSLWLKSKVILFWAVWGWQEARKGGEGTKRESPLLPHASKK